MSIKKSVTFIHLWLGLISGLVVFILGITGCIYAFIDEIKPVVYKQRMYVEVPDNAIKRSPAEVLASAQKALGEKYPVKGIRIPTDPTKTYICLSNAPGEGWSYFHRIKYSYSVYINPYTAEVVKIEDSKTEFFRIVLWLHWSLLLNDSIGQPIVGVATIIFVLSLITGIIVWWPKNKSAAKQRFWFRWKDTTKWKRKNYDLHNIAGFYLMFFTLIIALTGLVWAFKWFDNSVQWVANGGKTYEKSKPVLSDTTLYNSTKPVDKIWNEVRLKNPDAVSFFISIPGDSVSSMNVFVDNGSRFNSIQAKYDQNTGKLLHTSGYSDKNNGEKLKSLNYDIHVGSILGLPGKILAFFASLVAASLPVTGVLIWWGRRKKDVNRSVLKAQKEVMF